MGAGDDEIGDDHALDELGPWRQLKIPFTAFRDRAFYGRAEKISVIYLLLSGEEPGPYVPDKSQHQHQNMGSRTAISRTPWRHCTLVTRRPPLRLIGRFALEVGEIKAGRCDKAHLESAGQWGHAACEQGLCGALAHALILG